MSKTLNESPATEIVVSDTGYNSKHALEVVAPTAAESHRAAKETALVRKLDLFIAPLLIITTLVSYLDRGNIGFAATQGMGEDIHLKGTQLNTAISIFFVSYVLTEVPSSMLVKRFQFNRVIPTLIFCWGFVCLGTGFVQSFGPLVATRLILGVFEGCMFPAMVLLLCNWYKREEMAVRISFLFIATSLSGAFGGLLSWAMLRMDGVAGYAGWRWLYIIEGIITVVWSLLCIFLVPKDYETAFFLNEEDRALMRIRAEEAKAYSGGDGHYSVNDVKLAALDIKTWIHGTMQMATATVLYGFGTFLPIIIKDSFHYSTVEAQYLVIPVHLWGAFVYAIGATLSDKYQVRFVPLALFGPIGIAGYAVLLCDVPARVQYASTFVISTSFYISTGNNMAWLAGNCAPDGKRAASMGILLALTNIGGVISGQIYQANKAPAFTLGYSWSLASMAYAWVGAWLMRMIYVRRQAIKERALADREMSLIDPTDRSPDFNYII